MDINTLDLAALYAYASDLMIEAPTDSQSAATLKAVRARIAKLSN